VSVPLITVVSKLVGQGVRHFMQKLLVSVPGGHLPSAATISYTHQSPVLLLPHCQLTDAIIINIRANSERFVFIFESFGDIIKWTVKVMKKFSTHK